MKSQDSGNIFQYRLNQFILSIYGLRMLCENESGLPLLQAKADMIIQIADYPVTGRNDKVSNEVNFGPPLTQAIDEFISLALIARDELSVLLTHVVNKKEL